MDFSPWDRAKIFQLHEAACLIAGVMPSSKRFPDRAELPANALQYYKSLATAYVLWVTHYEKPDDPNYPKDEMLKGEPQIGSDKPTLAVSIEKLVGEFVSRDELRRWIEATGIKSAYSFAPWNRTATPSVAPEPQAEAPAVGVSGGDDWKAKARARAVEIIERQHQRDLYPSQTHIADEIAAEFRKAGIVGADGKPLAGASIKRHALKGISSAQDKQLSTSIRRGK